MDHVCEETKILQLGLTLSRHSPPVAFFCRVTSCSCESSRLTMYCRVLGIPTAGRQDIFLTFSFEL